MNYAELKNFIDLMQKKGTENKKGADNDEK